VLDSGSGNINVMVGVGTGVSSGEGTEGGLVGPLLASVVALLVASNSVFPVFPVVGCSVILAQLVLSVVSCSSEHVAETVYVDWTFNISSSLGVSSVPLPNSARQKYLPASLSFSWKITSRDLRP